MSALDDEIDRKWPLPNVPSVGAMEAARLNEAYSEERRRHLALNPIIESTGPFVITPELERERQERVARQQWREPEREISAVDIEILQLKGAI